MSLRDCCFDLRQDFIVCSKLRKNCNEWSEWYKIWKMSNTMILQKTTKRICLHILSVLLLSTLLTMTVSASDLGGPQLSEPLQKEKFFNPERYTFTDITDSAKTVVQPHLSISHDAREEDVGLGLKQTSERFHGEAGGKLNLLGDISLTTFAKIPVYIKETVGSLKTSDGESNSGLFKSTGRFSWRSELGIPVKKGVDLNFFYDSSTFGRIDKPGVEEREEKFGTRFIFTFE